MAYVSAHISVNRIFFNKIPVRNLEINLEIKFGPYGLPLSFSGWRHIYYPDGRHLSLVLHPLVHAEVVSSYLLVDKFSEIFSTARLNGSSL